MINFLRFGRRRPAWLEAESKDKSRSCQLAVERTMKAIKKLMLTDDQAKLFFEVERNYQKEKKSIREMYFHLPEIRDEELQFLAERKLDSMQTFLDANQWALYRVESI